MRTFHKTLPLLAVLGVLAGSSACAAAQEVAPLSSFGAFTDVQSIAVDQSSGDVYVYDAAEGGRISRFDAQGEPLEFAKTGVNTIEGVGAAAGLLPGEAGTGEEQLAIDSSSGPAKGDIYLANGGVVEIYASAGEHEGEKIGELNNAGEPWFRASGVAVDPAGKVYVSAWTESIDEYTPTTAIPTDADLTAALPVGFFPGNIAVDGAGDVFVQSFASFTGPPAGKLTEYPAKTTVDPVSSSGLALSARSGRIFSDQQTRIVQYDARGSTTGLHSYGPLTGSYGVAIDAQSGAVYAATAGGTTIDVFATTPGPAAPIVERELSASVGATSAELQTQIDPQLSPTRYYFQYGTSTAYTAGSVPAAAIPVGEGEEPRPARVALSGLQPDTIYHYRAVAFNEANGKPETTNGEDQTFTTTAAPPEPTPIATSGPPVATVGAGATPQPPAIYPDLTSLKPLPAPKQAAGKPKAKSKAKPCKRGVAKRHNKCVRIAKANRRKR
jgi:hypothetical protein